MVQQDLFSVYEQAKDLVRNHGFCQDAFREIEAHFESKKYDPELSIMVYGVYNAGKSTFINALIGEELAAMDDVPLTDIVTAYPYKNYHILDTPGIDAPIEHEQVAEEQLQKSDIVLFVVNPLGVAEEQATLEKLIDLFAMRKKVFLIFNEKSEISEEDFIYLKEQTRYALQEMAIERNISQEVLDKIPIFKINAKRALVGKLKNKAQLVSASGIDELEFNLNIFIDQILENNDVYNTLKANLTNFLEDSIDIIKAEEESAVKNMYDQLSYDIKAGKVTLKKDVKKDIKIASNELEDSIQAWLHVNDQESDILIRYQEWINLKFSYLSQKFIDYTEEIALKIRADIEQLEIYIPEISPLHLDFSIDGSYAQEDDGLTDAEQNSNGILNVDKVGMALTATKQLSNKVKPEHLVETMKLVKRHMPDLMKGIGPKTMEKMANNVLSKAGPVLMAATLAYDLWKAGEDQNRREEAFRKQKEAQQKILERRNAQIKDVASQSANRFYMETECTFMQSIDEYFSQFETLLDRGRLAFNKAEQENSLLLAQLSELRQGLA